MANARNIVDELGRASLQRVLGVKKAAISAAVVADRFPACWYLSMVELAKEQGRSTPIPLCMFNWKRAPEKREEGNDVSPL